MAKKDMISHLQDTLLVMLVAVAVGQSASYFISGSKMVFRIFRYTGVSPYAVAFVHPSFFLPKEVRLHYRDSVETIDILKHDRFFNNRSSYRALMFPLDTDRKDIETIARQFFCKPPEFRSPLAVEYVQIDGDQTQGLKVICEP